jgi:hypothetical protein
LLWLGVSALAGCLLFALFGPTYEAVSVLRVEPTKPRLFDGPLREEFTDRRRVQPYLLTQINLIKSNQVLEAAVAYPTVLNFPMIKNSIDPKADLRENLTVEIVEKDTYLIRVALESSDPAEAAAIINAVVRSYLDQHNRFHQGTNSTLRKFLVEELNKLEQDIQTKKTKLTALGKKANVEDRPIVGPKPTEKDADPALQPSFSVVTAEQYARLTDRLIQADFELIDAQAGLETAKSSKEKSPRMVSEEKFQELEAVVENAKRKRLSYSQYLAKIYVADEAKNKDTLLAAFEDRELSKLQEMQQRINQKLKQLDFETNQDTYRVALVDKAAVPKLPSNNWRLEVAAAALIGALFLVFGIFLIREIKFQAAGDPDAS